jgi:hypothetical protein
MYNLLIPLLLGDFPPGTNPQVKLTIHKVIRSQCDFTLADSISVRPGGALVELVLSSRGKSQYGWLTANGETITDRYEYDEEAICSLASVSGNRIAIHEESGYSPIEIAVALNKQLLTDLFPDEGGKWFFTRIQLERPFKEEDTHDLSIEYEMNLKNNVLNRSRLYVGRESVGTIFFSSVRQ